MDSIYLDNNSTTPMLPAVLDAMRPYLTADFGNPASAHRTGSRARKALEDAREAVASMLDAHADEVVFTSGATEANNLALFGLAGAPPGHLIVSPIEHPSVAEPIARFEKTGFVVDRLPVDSHGVVDPKSFTQLLRPDTRLVSVMLVNHETGAVQPVQLLNERLERRSAFHCDATQAVGRISVRFHELGVSTLAFSAHKFHGPKGVGALLIARGTSLQPLMWGGHQQHGKRPGTESVALAVGLARALKLATEELEKRTEIITQLRRIVLEHLMEHAAPVIINGSPEGTPHALNLSFPGCQADVLLMNLDLAGVACSTGSACSSGSLLPSPVLKAMGVSEDVLQSAMRFSFSALLSTAEVTEAAQRVATAVRRLRR